jgi:hypothetical protein
MRLFFALVLLPVFCAGFPVSGAGAQSSPHHACPLNGALLTQICENAAHRGESHRLPGRAGRFFLTQIDAATRAVDAMLVTVPKMEKWPTFFDVFGIHRKYSVIFQFDFWMVGRTG